jgi:polar amino acid transport system substrate-binding protein
MKGLRVLMLAIIAMTVVAACSNEPQAGSGSSSNPGSSPATSAAGATPAVSPPADIAEAGAISFCTAPPYPPAIFQENGEVKGSEVDIGNAVAATMGVKADWVVIGFDGFIAAVQSGKCDGYLGASTHTPERAEQVHFTDYVTVGRNYLVPKGNPKGINSESDLCGLSISLLVGTTEKEAVDDESTKCTAAGKPAIDVQVFDQDTAAGLALVTGKVDAYVSDSPGLVYYVNKNPDKFQLALPESVNPAPWGIATKKDATELNDALQQAVDAIYADGTMQQILDKWGLSTIALK